ncbi:UDP-N-acetylmuramoyl-L-alanine--D-glutamate ligase [bacterium]|nr:UDP-N-acetylmuramoyl-L-alanine--D-glutamate ligase [bacterium]
MSLEELKNKKILILGFGKEGKDTFLALRKLFPRKILAIADRQEFKKLPEKTQYLLRFDKKTKLYFGKDYLNSLKNYNLIIKTPGIPLKIIKPFLKKGTKITSQTEIFFDNCPGKIVGVTGTKGKGTTASLIYKILKKGGLKVHLVGNIGKPVFQSLLRAKKNDIFVYELSSHQLQNLKKSPQIAVFLNLWPAHLDYYKNFQNYKKAKENITLHQRKNDFFIYNSEQKELREVAEKTNAKKIPIKPTNYEFKRIRNEIKKIPLIGKFNLFNTITAIKVGKLFNIPKTKIKEALKEFKPLPHRLEYVGKYRGIEFYNDSLATVPQATIAALEALRNKVKTLILGGSDKGGIDFSLLAKRILKSNVKTLIFLSPGTGKKIWQEILNLKKNSKNLPKSFFVRSMKEAIKTAYENTEKGSACLLSPAAPSFNLFKNYRQRGNLFKRFIKIYGGKK